MRRDRGTGNWNHHKGLSFSVQMTWPFFREVGRKTESEFPNKSLWTHPLQCDIKKSLPTLTHGGREKTPTSRVIVKTDKWYTVRAIHGHYDSTGSPRVLDHPPVSVRLVLFCHTGNEGISLRGSDRSPVRPPLADPPQISERVLLWLFPPGVDVSDVSVHVGPHHYVRLSYYPC